MIDGTEGKQIAYSSSDISDILKIQESTLRKYALLLQEAGYKFVKNEHGQRAYLDRDVIVLKRLIQTKKQADTTLKQAVSLVMTWVKENDVSQGDTGDITVQERHNEELLQKFDEFKEQQLAFNQELIRRLEERDKYIEESLRKRDEQLVSAIREIQETKRLQAAAQEEEIKEKKSWWKFWK